MWNYNHWTGVTGRAKRSPEPPKNRVALYFWVFREHFWDLLRLNLFVLLCSLPVVTVFPAITAMNRIIINMLEDRPQMLWLEYWSLFRRECKTAILAGLPLTVVAALLILGGGFFRDAEVSGWGSLAALLGLAVVFLLGCYLLCMLPYVELSVLQCYKNAFLMLFVCFWRNVVTLLAVLVLAAIFVLGHPLTTPVLLLFAVPLFGYFITFRVYFSVKKYIVQADE